MYHGVLRNSTTTPREPEDEPFQELSELPNYEVRIDGVNERIDGLPSSELRCVEVPVPGVYDVMAVPAWFASKPCDTETSGSVL